MAETNDFKSQLEKAIFDIDQEVFRMPNQEHLDFRQYSNPQIVIKRISYEQEGPSIAELKITITKEPTQHILNYRKSDGTLEKTEIKPFENWHSYWLLGIRQHLERKITLTEKAVILQEFIDDIKRNFSGNEHARRITEIASRLHTCLADICNVSPEKEYFPIRLDTVKTEAEMPKVNVMHAINLRKTVHLKPENYEKIRKHEEEGKFDLGIPLEMQVVAYVLLE